MAKKTTPGGYVSEADLFRKFVTDRYSEAMADIEQIDRDIAEMDAQREAAMVRRADLAEVVDRASLMLNADTKTIRGQLAHKDKGKANA